MTLALSKPHDDDAAFQLIITSEACSGIFMQDVAGGIGYHKPAVAGVCAAYVLLQLIELTHHCPLESNHENTPCLLRTTIPDFVFCIQRLFFDTSLHALARDVL